MELRTDTPMRTRCISLLSIHLTSPNEYRVQIEGRTKKAYDLRAEPGDIIVLQGGEVMAEDLRVNMKSIQPIMEAVLAFHKCQGLTLD